MYLKLHKSYRTVVAVCDAEILGKKFEEGIKQLELRENFYKGEEISEEKALEIMSFQSKEDATFNIVGEKSIKTAIKAGIIDQESVGKIQGIPYALVLL